MTATNESWLQRNAFLVAAGALPLLVVVFFLAATKIPQWTVADPAHDPVFALVHYNNQSAGLTLDFRAEAGRIIATARRLPENGYGTYQKLYRYHTARNELEPIEIDIPEPVRQRLIEAPLLAGQTPPFEEFALAVFENVPLSTRPVAPDGYSFEHSHASGRGLLGELFGMNRGRYRMGLVNSGRFVAIPPERIQSRYGYGNAVFLAWVESSE